MQDTHVYLELLHERGKKGLPLKLPTIVQSQVVPLPAIPQEMARVAHAGLPQGNIYMQMRDEVGTLYQDQDFLDLFPTHGQPAQQPWRLALVTVMQ
jgi:hypothetical protein